MRAVALLVLCASSLAWAEVPDLGAADQQEEVGGGLGDRTDEATSDNDDDDFAAVDAGAARAEAHQLVANRRFCKEGSAWLLEADRRWCGHIDGERCPGMKTACAKPEEPRSRPFRFPHLPGLEVVPWVVVILGLLVLVYAMARRFAPSATTLDGASADGHAAGAEIEYAELVGETDAERLLARAEAAMTRGDPSLALACLHAALLRVLGTAGLHLDRSKTNGDYVRELGGRPELRREVARIMALVERAQFGSELPSPSLFAEAVAVVRRLARGGTGLLLLTLIAVAGCVAGCGDFGKLDRASGRGAALEFLKTHGTTIVRRRQSLEKLTPTDDAILLMAEASLTPAQVTSLVKWVEGGGVLVVAGHANTLAAFELTTTDHPEAGTETVNDDGMFLRLDVPGRRRLVTTLAVVERRRFAPLIGSMESSYISGGWPGEGRVVALVDDDLLTDAALVSGDDAAILLWLFDQVPDQLQLVDELTGVSPPLPPSSLIQAHLLPVFAQLVVVLVLFGLYRGTAFGRRRNPPVPGRRRFVEHALACAAVYARGRVGRYALGLYAGLAIEQLRTRLRPRGAALAELAEAISRRTGRPLGEIMAILVEAQEASHPRPTADRSDRGDAPLDLLRALAQLLRHTGGTT